MLEPISVTALLYLGYPALAEYAQATSAISSEASRISEVAASVMRERQWSHSLFGAKAAALSELSSVVACLYVDDEQERVTSETYRNAEQFLLALPEDLPPPAFGIDPDGAISITWAVSRARIFSVSIAESERIAYAWLDGSDRGHAVARFRTPALPAVFTSALRSIVSDDAVSLRVA